MSKISTEVIENFLNGSNDKKYIVGIEAGYSEPKATLVINHPIEGKKLEKHKYKPFLWFKKEVTELLYEGKRMKILQNAAKFGVKIKALKVNDDNGHIPSRMENGYRYMAICDNSYNSLVNFFREGGVDIFDSEYKNYFMCFSPAEQFMIQTGMRLFKGIDDYNDVHRFQFDLETEGLNPETHGIFQIGVKDNKGFEEILEREGNTPQEMRDSEKAIITKFFKIIYMLKPDIIAGYNSENFDWDFFFNRCERLSIPITRLAIGLDGIRNIRRKDGTLKLGGEVESFKQTHIFGFNIIDISHSVRRAQAINSDIQKWGLKYITEFSDVAKPNRVYIKGDGIFKLWNNREDDFAFNDVNGDWYKISEKIPIKDGYNIVKGNYIVQRYLLDDLWETEKVDLIFNQAAFLIAKMLPTTYERSITMGTAGQWKLIMSAWSYENKLAIPELEPKRNFTGGLSRLLEVGYAKNVVKLDYAALYPKTELTWSIFPALDISGVMEGLLAYVVDTRDKYKFLLEKTKKKRDNISDFIKKNKETLSSEELDKLNKELNDEKVLVSLYDKKQLPLKILANSWFGSYGAPYIFNWGESDCAEETTCRGRQYLRLMVKYFVEKYNFKPLVGDSVTYDTPVYIKNLNNNIDILPICDLFNSESKYLDSEGLRDFEPKSVQILTRNGWKDIIYIYRHESNKIIHRVTTKDRLINVTEDHSLFQNGVEIKPSELKRYDKIDIFNIPKFQTSTVINDIDEAYLAGFFLGDGSATCSYRTQKYKSKKTGLINISKSKRADWKISNTNLELLEKLQTIIKNKYNIKSSIKNHISSSGVYNLVVNNSVFANVFCEHFYTSYREKKIPLVILNSSLFVKKAFIEGVFASDGYGNDIESCSDIGMKSQIAMAGIAQLLSELDIEYKIKTRPDKENFISFSLKNSNRNNSSFTNKTLKKSDEVWKNENIKNKDVNKFVYDISTEDGTFICGIGGIIAHNTDGVNFSYPDNINEIKYIPIGNHWKTKEDAGVELSGLNAILAEFNENYMIGRMGLDIDEYCESTINFSRKNYAKMIKGKVKLVGNSIKSKKMPTYIEDFLNKGIKLLLDGKGYEFIECYNDYVDKIYNYKIPLVKIASKSKVNTTMAAYRKKANMKNKAGNPMPKQAHMELALKANLDLNMGDVLYYINTGTSKSQGDLKTIRDKEKGTTELQLNCKLIPSPTVESDFETIKEIDAMYKLFNETEDENVKIKISENINSLESSLYVDEYNVPKYLESFNKKVLPLLVCFNPEIRKDILIKIVKDKKTKIESLGDRKVFTIKECELISGLPDKPEAQDSYIELMKMEDKEIKFWDKVNKIPNNMEIEEWEIIRADYFERKRIEKLEGIEHEKNKLIDIFKRLETKELNAVINEGMLPIDVFIIADIDSNSDNWLVSRIWNEPLCHINCIFDYEKDAAERSLFYQMNGIEITDKDRYEKWLDYKAEQLIMTGFTSTNESITESLNINKLSDILKEKSKEIIIPTTNKSILDNEEDNDDEEVEIESEIIEIDELSPDAYYIEYQKENLYNKITLNIEEQDKANLLHVEEKDEWNF